MVQVPEVPMAKSDLAKAFERIDLGVTQEELEAKVEELNADKSVHALLVQLPLPKNINEVKILDKISAWTVNSDLLIRTSF